MVGRVVARVGRLVAKDELVFLRLLSIVGKLQSCNCQEM